LANQITETDADWLVPRVIQEPMFAFGTKRRNNRLLIHVRFRGTSARLSEMSAYDPKRT
jgi:hypothetical protein